MALTSFDMEFSRFRDDHIIDMCRDKTVLHFGAGDYPFTAEKKAKGLLLHEHIDRVSRYALAAEYDSMAVDSLIDLGYDSIQCDVMDSTTMKEIQWSNYQVIVFGEIIEHLANPGQALRNIISCISDDAVIILSTPNAFFGQNFVNALFSKENVHPDHVMTFSPVTLNELIEQSGGKVIKKKSCFLNRVKLKYSSRFWFFTSRFFPTLAETLLYHVEKK